YGDDKGLLRRDDGESELVAGRGGGAAAAHRRRNEKSAARPTDGGRGRGKRAARRRRAERGARDHHDPREQQNEPEPVSPVGVHSILRRSDLADSQEYHPHSPLRILRDGGAGNQVKTGNPIG